MKDSNSATVDPTPPANPGLDFFHLKRQGTAWVQELSGEVWTDYNEHDPGVTTLEQLAYALTELSYRASLPVADFLTRADGKIDPSLQALYSPATILTCQPVTIADYRKLLIDRVEALANVWIEPQAGGLYKIFAYVPGLDLLCQQDRVCDLKRQISEVYAAHRNLCADLAAVEILAPLAVEIHGDVVLDDASECETVLAEIFFQLGNTLAPELRRRPLDQLLARGDAPGEIFNGPLLQHGFIDRHELQPKARCFTVRDLAQVILGVRGVLGVSRLAFPEPGRPSTERLDVPTDKIPALRIHRESGTEDARFGCSLAEHLGFTFRHRRRGGRLRPDMRQVERLLHRRWTAHRRTYVLERQYPTAFALPSGRSREFAAYASIQSQYPGVYGIGELGVADSASDARKGLANQLKGYLLAFEQLLADFFAQLAHVKDLFAIDPKLTQTHFSQPLDDLVPRVAPLLRPPSRESPGYHDGLERLVASQDNFVERRGRFLDLLLALYGERLESRDLWQLGDDEEKSECGQTSPALKGTPAERRISAELELLQQLVAATAERGRAIDSKVPLWIENQAGMQIRVRIQLEFPPPSSPPLREVLDGMGVELVRPEIRATLGHPLVRRRSEVESSFEPVFRQHLGSGREPGDADLMDELDSTERVGPPLAGQSLHADLVEAAADLDHLRIGVFSGESRHAVVCRSPLGVGGGWRLLEHREDASQAWIAAHAWQDTMGQLSEAMKQLYLVEHLLLRDAIPGDIPSLDAALFDFAFTLSAVLSAPPSALHNSDWCAFVRRVVRRNAPAHLVVWVLFVPAPEMPAFEILYWQWRQALCDGNPQDRCSASIALRNWLIAHRKDVGSDPPIAHGLRESPAEGGLL